jgi:hypothetical protein
MVATCLLVVHKQHQLFGRYHNIAVRKNIVVTGTLVQINHELGATFSPVCYLDVYLQLNMFRASSCSAVGRGRAGPTTTNSTAITTLQR